jgi:hypothetical protein
MADIALNGNTSSATEMQRVPRLLFIDNIRWSMIFLVLMHASDNHSPFGNWHYLGRQATSPGTGLFFGGYQSFLQAFSVKAALGKVFPTLHRCAELGRVHVHAGVSGHSAVLERFRLRWLHPPNASVEMLSTSPPLAREGGR